jgi:hypothetical protein
VLVAGPTLARTLPPPARLILPSRRASQLKVGTPATLGVPIGLRSLVGHRQVFLLRAGDLIGPGRRRMSGLVVFRWTPQRLSLGPRRAGTVTLWLTPRPDVPLGTYRVRLEALPQPAIPGRAAAAWAVLTFSVGKGP